MRVYSLLLTILVTSTSSMGRSDSLARNDKSFQEITIGEGAGDDRPPLAIQQNSRNTTGFSQEAQRYYNRDLRERIRLLEIAVKQLQDEVYHLKRPDTKQPERRRQSYTCFLNTPFNGSFYGKGETQLEAKAKTLNECEKKDKGYCNANQVNCEKSE